jgi:hypothetical protein
LPVFMKFFQRKIKKYGVVLLGEHRGALEANLG